MRKSVARLLEFGRRGHVIQASHEHCSGYEDPESFLKPYHWWADAADKTSRHWDGYEWPVEGVPVIDKRQAIETDAGFKLAINGPMVDVDLKNGEVDRCPEPSSLFAAGVAGNAFGGLLTLQKVSRLVGVSRGPLDSVSIAEFVQLWRNVGARIGRCFVSEDGQTCRIDWE